MGFVYSVWECRGRRLHFFGCCHMTIREASQRYQRPEYSAGIQEPGTVRSVKNVMVYRQYHDTNPERPSIIMTLRNIGFTAEEEEVNMRLLLEGESSGARRLRSCGQS